MSRSQTRAMPESRAIVVVSRSVSARVAGLLLGLSLALTPALLCAQSAPGSEPPRPDPGRGRQLYENHCQVCHTSQVHIRERRKGSDAQTVKHQIYRWRAYLGLDWGVEEVEDVYTYLEQRFYRFGEDRGE